jgi:replicative DNA helicase
MSDLQPRGEPRVASPPPKPAPAQRQPHHSAECEKAVLGSVLLKPSIIGLFLELLAPDGQDFYIEANRYIWRAMVNLHEGQVDINLRSLQASLQSMTTETGAGEVYELIGGLAYLTSLDNFLPDLGAAPAHKPAVYNATVVRRLAIRRQLVADTMRVLQAAYGPDEDEGEGSTEALAAQLEQAAVTAQERMIVQPTLLHAGQATREALAEYNEAVQANKLGQVIGVETPWQDLTRLLNGGLKRQRFYVIGARPGVGKSSFAVNIAIKAAIGAIDRTKPGAIFSLEMGRTEVGRCLLAAVARVPKDFIEAGDLTAFQEEEVVDAHQAINAGGIYIDDSAELTPLLLRARAKRFAQQLEAQGRKLSWLIIDYLQLMSGGGRFESRQAEVSSISRKMKALAKELDIPVVALSQLGRQSEKRADSRPQMADLRESGAIEQDADCVILLYRPELYDRDDPNKRGKAEADVAKNRGGRTGVVQMMFKGEIGVFEAVDPRDEQLGIFGA